MRKTITTEDLQRLRKGHEGFVLIDVVDRAGFAKDHIPGASNVPLTDADFAQAVATKASGSRTRKVVLYGAGIAHEESSKAVELLVANGFTNVFEYRGGLAAWNESKRARTSKAK
jgi:rhodanese-related sulfurtransferase